MNQNKIVCVFGGTGFVGRQVVRNLADLGYIVKLACRIPEKAYFLKTAGNVGQIVPTLCDITDDQSIIDTVKDCSFVVNLIGVLFEKGKRSNFELIHTDFPKRLAKICENHNVERFVHISALGVDICTSKYALTKLAGEKAILENFARATILRPSIIFGPEDNFFNMFAKLAAVLPAFPLIGGGKTKFQPVYVGDVAEAITKVLTIPALGDNNPMGKIYELGGPTIYSFKELYEILFQEIGIKRKLITLPWAIAKIQGNLMSLLPQPLLTADQVEALKTDSIISENSLNFSNLDMYSTAMETILPTYLDCYKVGGRFADKKAA